MRCSFIICCVLLGVSSVHGFLWFGGSGRQEAEGLLSEECIRKAEQGDCMFYVCFDQRHPCDYNNYALSYGWRFCDKISKNYDRFTLQAKNWINGTRVCSMTKMVEFYRATHINCGDVAAEMRERHAECEAENGGCDGDMMMENKDVLSDVYTFDRKVLMRFVQMLRECGVSSSTEFVTWLGSQGKIVMAFFRSLPDRLAGLQEDIDALRESLPDLDLPDLSDLSLSDLKLPEMPKMQRLPEEED